MSHSIKAIAHDSVHRLNAGQVVLELQGAIKELVENSLDAGASSIDVRIRDHGLESIEISDNGSGIGEADWPYVGAKHHTSKLPALSDLPHVTTFGFRGEALASLCALCESVTITTSTKETAPMGTIVKLGNDGCVTDSSTRVARPRGTTVLLTGLFAPLPVRRKEFERTAKREFTKALTQLYALKVESLAAGKANKRTMLLATDGRGSLRSSISSVWGHKALEGVLDLELGLDVEVDQLMARREGIEARLQRVTVSGLISSAAWGQGRTSPDRQFYYINGRPCDLRQISKVVNEVYKSFNTHQVPLAVLDFQIPPESVDINVSPDKRTIFLHSEANLISALRVALEAFWMPSRSAYAVQDTSTPVKISRKGSNNERGLGANVHDNRADETPDGPTPDEDGEQAVEDQPMDKDDNAKPSVHAAVRHSSRRSDTLQLDESEEGESELSQPLTTPISRHNSSSTPIRAPIIPSSSARHASSSSSRVDSSRSRQATERTIDTTKASWSPNRKGKESVQTPAFKSARVNLRERLKGFASQSGDAAMPEDDDNNPGDEHDEEEQVEGAEAETSRVEDEADKCADSQGTDVFEEPLDDEVGVVHATLDRNDTIGREGELLGEQTARGQQRSGSIFDDEATDTEEDVTKETDNVDDEGKAVSHSFGLGKRAASPSSSDIDQPGSFPSPAEPSRPSRPLSSSAYRDEIPKVHPSGEVTLSLNLPRLRQRYAQSRKVISSGDASSSRTLLSTLSEGTLSSAAGVGNRDAATAEEALSRVIQKTDFDKMEILGQFNKGFIIVRLRDQGGDRKGKGKAKDDLFIVDQHASDEKFNFETLQRTTVIKAQRLIKPRAMQLTAGDEIVAIENMDILKANGFEVDVDEEELPGRGERVKLVAMPVSKETVFDFKDLEQLLHLLGDGARPAGQMVRCSKARSMFAMRACRKSVMIGKSLAKGQMVQLLRNMGTIDQPWNCPHGRPTMRHLAKIEAGKLRSGMGRIDWSKWTPVE